MKPVRRRLLMLLGAVLVLAIGWPATRLWRSGSALRHYRAALAARGERLTAAELQAPIDLGARQAGGELAFVLARGRPLGNRTDLPGLMRFIAQGVALPAARQDELLNREGGSNAWPALVQEMTTYWERVDAAKKVVARSPTIDFDLRYEQGFDLALPHLQGLRDLGRLLALSVALHLRAGEVAAAVDDLLSLLAAIHSFRDEATLISQLTRASMASLAVSATWDLLQSDGVTEADLAKVQAAWEPVTLLSSLTRGVERERVVQHDFFERVRTSPAQRRQTFQAFLGGGMPAMKTGPPGSTVTTATLTGFAEQVGAILERSGELTRVWLLETLWRSLWCYEDELQATRFLQTLLDGVRAAERGEPFTAILRRVEEQVRARREPVGLTSLRGMFSSQFALSSRMMQRPMLVEAQRRLALTALALKRHRLRRQTWPDRIEILVPEFLDAPPRDPYDGKTLRYRIDAEGRFLMYSVGEDGLDQGGDPTPAEGNPYQPSFWRGQDLVWPRPATAAEVAAYKSRPGGRRP